MRKPIVAALAGLLFGSVLILGVFFRGAQPNSLQFEVAKSLLQLGIVAVIGAVISLLVFEYQRDRQAKDKIADLARQALEKRRDIERKGFEYRESLLHSVLSRTLDAYGRVKKARRLFRGRAIVFRGGVEVVLANQYDLYFELINGAQFDLENLARDVEMSAKAFSKPAVLLEHLRAMEGYLGTLIGGYERSRRLFSGGEESIPLSQLLLLEDSIRPAKLSSFMKGMVDPCHEVQRRIRGDLLHPNLPESGATTTPHDTGLGR